PRPKPVVEGQAGRADGHPRRRHHRRHSTDAGRPDPHPFGVVIELVRNRPASGPSGGTTSGDSTPTVAPSAPPTSLNRVNAPGHRPRSPWMAPRMISRSRRPGARPVPDSG